MNSLTPSYDHKEQRYFAGVRSDLIDRLPPDRKRAILEIGCGEGSTAAYAKREGKCGLYVGVELFPPAASAAASRIDRVYTANIECFDLPEPSETFDVLIAGEVLEHLVDPWAVLRRLRTHLRPGALVVASSPNVSHYSVISMLLKGDWTLADSGRMDRTHLRWFTPKSYAGLFGSCGFEVLSTEPLRRPGRRAKLIGKLSGGRLEHLFISQIVVISKKTGAYGILADNICPKDALQPPHAGADLQFGKLRECQS
jgi:2-polyprenyl-3-methyl-5-hydroxy-6-metoxy-1,4-benzoquinol methylase